jgi:hypothetical protein
MLRRRPLRSLIGKHFACFRKSQRRTISDLLLGLLTRGKIGLAAIARGMEDQTTVRHRIKRAWRFVQNPRISCEVATVALAGWVVSLCEGTMVVALDWTYVGDYVLLAAKVAVGHRAVPVAWSVMKKCQFDKDRNSRNTVEEQLVKRLRDALGEVRWILVADRGFARADFLRKLKDWEVLFVIRAPGTTWVRGAQMDCILDNVPRRPWELRRYDGVLYHRSKRVCVSLVVTHEEPAAEPWYLVTNLSGGAKSLVKAYRRRMWIEESFRDAKSNLQLKGLWLATRERMERMMILVALVMLLAVVVGTQWRAANGSKDPQLSTKRRGGTLSVFRIGLELIRTRGLPSDLHTVRLSCDVGGL